MKCTACGYDDTEQGPVNTDRIKIDGTGTKEKFIELRNVARPPFGYVNNNGTAKMTGEPALLFACPNCGTVKMDIVC